MREPEPGLSGGAEYGKAAGMEQELEGSVAWEELKRKKKREGPLFKSRTVIISITDGHFAASASESRELAATFEGVEVLYSGRTSLCV